MEEKLPLEDETENKEGRGIKKTWDFTSFDFLTTYTKETSIFEVHHLLYLLGLIPAPLIAVISEPPELG